MCRGAEDQEGEKQPAGKKKPNAKLPKKVQKKPEPEVEAVPENDDTGCGVFSVI